MKCGNCHQGHETVAQVKECYRTTPAAEPVNFDHQWSRHMQQELWPVRRMDAPTDERRTSNRMSALDQINTVGARVPTGRYALWNLAIKADNDISFYIVERPEQGKWAGKTFVKRFSSDETVRMPVAHQLSVLNRIAADIEGALALYGKKTMRCGICHRKLTNQESRERGIGPICAQANGL